ncbi:MAG TPA: hypothetical protein VGB24_03020 [Longimicrobium sp.]|uniref:hypothetical protein n=1 Tax=Longimicrobium sp. TaxID=2029185 RepID=UPI002ED7DC3E
MKIRAALLSLIAAILLAACTTTSAVLLGGSGTYPELNPAEVRVFLRERDVPAEYERIALVTAKSDAGWTDETDLIRAMRKRAAKLGANAIIIGDISDPTTLERVAEVLTDYEPQRRGRAVAIRLAE